MTIFLFSTYSVTKEMDVMELIINKEIMNVQASVIREMKSLADTYEDVIDFTLGEPHLYHQTYEVIKDTLMKRLSIDSLGYANYYGVLELREAISTYCREEFNQVYNPKSEILVTTGVSESISAVLKTILNPGDEVIVFNPSFTLYSSNIKMYGGKVVVYDIIENQMKVDKKVLSSLISNQTKAIIINSPCNPTGQLLSADDLDSIYDCIKDKPIFILSDEIYRELVFDQPDYHSISDYNDLRERLFIMNGFPKSLALTGWRVGYVMGPATYIKRVSIVHQNMVASISTVSQYAAIEAMKHPEITENLCEVYRQNRDYAYETLKPYFKNIIRPDGAFYMYLDVSNYQMSSETFALMLLREQRVALVPGIAFENKDSGYVRLSYCCNFEVLKKGINRILNFGKIL